jgi:hypothetical protein
VALPLRKGYNYVVHVSDNCGMLLIILLKFDQSGENNEF